MADTDKNVIPSLYAAGQFTAITPFTTVVDESIFYKVEDVCTAAQFRNRNIDVWGLMFGESCFGIDCWGLMFVD